LGKEKPEPQADPTDANVGPGAYYSAKPFEANAKPMTIGAKRPQKIEQTNGPGAYDPESAMDAIRAKSPTTKFSKMKGRPESLAHPEQSSAGPGEYYSAQPFDAKVKPMTIGQKRDKPPQSTTGKDTGPGAYDPDRAQG